MSPFDRLPSLFEAAASASTFAKTGPLTIELRYTDVDIARRIVPSFLPSQPAGDCLRVLYSNAAAHDFSDWVPGKSVEALRHNGDRRFLYWHPGPQGVLYAMDYASRTALVWCEANEFPAWECTRPALPLIQAALADSSWLPLHAAAMARHGRALLLAGPGKAGKTSASLACALAGWDFAGDDFVLVDVGAPARVAPLYASARLRADMVTAFGELAGLAIEISSDEADERHELRLGGLLPSSRFAGGEIAAILLPFRGGALRPEIKPAKPFDALSVLMRTTGMFLPGWRETMTKKFMALIERAPIFTVDTGMNRAAIPEALDDLLRRL